MSFMLKNNSAIRNTCIYVHGEREKGGNFATYSVHEKKEGDDNQLAIIVFQRQSEKFPEVNGVYCEDLIDICVHYLSCLQTGPDATVENGQAIEHLKHAMFYLEKKYDKA